MLTAVAYGPALKAPRLCVKNTAISSIRTSHFRGRCPYSSSYVNPSRNCSSSSKKCYDYNMRSNLKVGGSGWYGQGYCLCSWETRRAWVDFITRISLSQIGKCVQIDCLGTLIQSIAAGCTIWKEGIKGEAGRGATWEHERATCR
jgi:hypothetical protein